VKLFKAEDTTYLGFSVCIGDTASIGITKIRFKSTETDPLVVSFSCMISPNMLFKRCFANDLLVVMSSFINKGIVLIGSSGISKSGFQHMCIFNLHHLLTSNTGM
jgi:hypothetical protein